MFVNIHPTATSAYRQRKAIPMTQGSQGNRGPSVNFYGLLRVEHKDSNKNSDEARNYADNVLDAVGIGLFLVVGVGVEGVKKHC